MFYLGYYPSTRFVALIVKLLLNFHKNSRKLARWGNQQVLIEGRFFQKLAQNEMQDIVGHA